MLVTIRYRRGITLDCYADVTWEASAGQSLGSARVRIPRDSPAWDADIISESGGFLVDITTGAGRWRGIADAPVWSPEGMEIRCQHIMSWARIRHVGTTRRLHGLTPGGIVRRAVTDALIGLGSAPVTVGAIVEAPPVIASYEFKGQSLLTVLADMQQQSGQAWLITNDLQFEWRQQVGRYRELTLVDDGRYLSTLQRTPLADQAAESIEIEQSGRTFTARDGTAPLLWPAQQIERIR